MGWKCKRKSGTKKEGHEWHSFLDKGLRYVCLVDMQAEDKMKD